ncbi:MAG: glycine cleavage system protein H [Bdellovibrionales bacterium]|nr:glycine cleavage system protein H [Bdellovibrionales bacterium]
MNEYDEGRIWFKKKAGLITVGLTEKALEEIGSVQAVQLPVEGDEVSQDDVVCEIEGSKQNFEVISPVDGSVVAVNDSLSEDFESLQGDPLDEGWILKLKAPKGDSDDEGDDEE